MKAFTSCSARSSPRPLRSLDELLAVYDYPAATQDHWRAVNAPHLVALVRGGSMFVNGKLVEREEDQQAVTPTIETAA